MGKQDMPCARRILRAGILSGLLWLVPAAPGIAAPADSEGQAHVLDMIVATVDDEVVLLSDLLSDVQVYVQQSGKTPDQAEKQSLIAEALENRIKEKMLIAKARRDEVQIGEDEVETALDRHVADLAEQAGGDARFQRELERQGLSERDLRKKLSDPMRDQLLIQRMLERVSQGIDVGADEVRGFYDENKDHSEVIPMRPRAVLLAHILVQAKLDAEREAALEARLNQAKSRIAAGEDFGKVAQDLSEDPAAARGGDLGWIRLADIALPELQLALSKLPAGEIRDDVVSGQGYHILKMEEREGTRVHFRQIFFAHPITEEDMQGAREKAREAWQKLNAGEAWEAVVKGYSDDGYTRESGGVLPVIPEDQLDDRYKSVVEALEPGEYSGVFLSEQGYQIVRLVERDEARPFRFEEIEEQLRTELLMRKRNAALDDYVATLKDELLIERKELPPLDTIAGFKEAP